MGRWVFHLGPHPVRRSIQPISHLRGYSQTTVAEWGLGKQGHHCDHIGPESEGRAGNDNPINLYNGDALGGDRRTARLRRPDQVRRWRKPLWELLHDWCAERYRQEIRGF